MNFYRTELHGHLLEIRRGDFGGEYVLLNGRMISNKPLAGWSATSHFFDIVDAKGTSHAIEVRIDRKVRMRTIAKGTAFLVFVNGHQRCRLETLGKVIDDLEIKCYHCGYSLKGLPVENGELRCPECGRHTVGGSVGKADNPKTDESMP